MESYNQMANSIEQLKNLLKIELDSDKYLIEALTHRSYAVEHSIKYDNQRLEFLGDAVLEIALTEYLFKRYPSADEGALTGMRSALARESALAKIARKIDLGSYMLIGRGELEANGNDRDSTLADLFEAVMGAIYLEAGFEVVNRVIVDLVCAIFPDPDKMLMEINPKGALQELAQRCWNTHPVYKTISVSGPEHQPIFEVEVQLNNHIAIGRAIGRKGAEMQAAQKLLVFLNSEELGAKNE